MLAPPTTGAFAIYCIQITFLISYIISFLIPPYHQILKSPQAEENRESIQPGHLDFDIFSIQS